jgi:hypothetical protein
MVMMFSVIVVYTDTSPWLRCDTLTSINPHGAGGRHDNLEAAMRRWTSAVLN